MLDEYSISNITYIEGNFTLLGGIPDECSIVFSFCEAVNDTELYALALLFSLSKARYMVCSNKMLFTFFLPRTVEQMPLKFPINIINSSQQFTMKVFEKVALSALATIQVSVCIFYFRPNDLI